jgi:hypothetical protein
MKNLFVITEEEKNRILGLHESATKNQYLISEQSLSNIPVNNIQTVVIGKSNNSNKHTLIDGTTYNNIILGFNRGNNQSNPNGTWYVQNEKYDKEFFGGNWSFDNNTKKYTFSSNDGTLNKSGDFAQWGAFDDLIRFVVKKYENSESMGDTSFAAALLKLAQDKNVPIKQDSLLAQQNKRMKYKVPQDQGEVLTKPEDVQAGVLKNAQDCGWGNDVEGYKNSGWACPKPGSGKVEGNKGTNVKNTQTQESPNVTRIKNLQTKVGLKNTGSLDQSTLKAIMDKLSQ